MRRILLAVMPVAVACAAVADEAGSRMTGEALQSLLPGATVTHVSKSGSQRRWRNEADGSLMATTDNKKYGSAMGSHSATSPGTWSINGDGQYCVRIDWKREEEKWCAYIVRAADGGYYLNAVDPTRRIDIAK